MTPRKALSNLMAAITGNDVLQSGLFVGTYQQHSVLQDSIEVLNRLVTESEHSEDGEAPGAERNPPRSDN
jgi:hypothetical protein